MTGAREHVAQRLLLLPHQSSFVQRFVSGGAARRWIVTGAPGSGKSTAAAGAAVALYDSRAATRVLIVAPDLLGAQYQARLEKLVDVPLVRLDRASLLELRDDAGQGTLTWPDRFVAIVGGGTVRHRDAAGLLANVNWDLAIIDSGALSDSASEQFAGELMQSETVQRVLVLATDRGGLPESLRARADAELSWGDDISGRPFSGAVPRWSVVDYSRSEDEAALLRSLDRLATLLAGARGLRDVVAVASSSVYALDSQLRAELLRTSAPFELASEPGQQSAGAGSIPDLLRQIETVGEDGKLAALLATIDARGDVIVMTEFTETADYVASCLTERGVRVSRPADRDDIRPQAETAVRRVVVASDASLEGVDVGPFSAMIHYDLPATGLFVWQRVLRASRWPGAEMVVFRDLSLALPFERSILAKLGIA